MTSIFTESEAHQIENAYFRHGAVPCPRCSTPLRIQQEGGGGRISVDLNTHCPRCGAAAYISRGHVDEIEARWTDAQRQGILNDYWQHSFANCPLDGARLYPVEFSGSGGVGVDVLLHCPCCGRYLDSRQGPTTDPAAQSLESRYATIGEIGRGGMGVVLRVRHRVTGVEYAAKQILPQYRKMKDYFQRFQREVKILSALDHPSIVKIHDSFLTPEEMCYVMDICEGGNLKAAIRDRRIPVRTLVDYLEGVVGGLAAFHNAGGVHRDMKPENILLDAHGKARLSDFGLAVSFPRDSSPLTETGKPLGTPLYAAPEQWTDAGRVGVEADFYSLTLIAWEVLIRKSPYTLKPGGVTGPFGDQLPRLLNEDPQARKTNGGEILSLLRQQIQHQEGTSTEELAPG